MKAGFLRSLIADIPDCSDLVVEYCPEMSTGEANIGLGAPRMEIKETREMGHSDDCEEVVLQYGGRHKGGEGDNYDWLGFKYGLS